MRKNLFAYTVLLIPLLVVICSCSTSELRTVDLFDPSPLSRGSYTHTPSMNELIKDCSHIVVVNLIDVAPHLTNTDYSIYTFSIISLLAGEYFSETIKVINPSGFYEFDETYLLFLYCYSSTIQPFDYYIPFNRHNFRVSEDGSIDCLQGLADELVGTSRRFVKPFTNPEHNKLSFLEGFIKKNSGTVKKITLASDTKELSHLTGKSDLIIEIEPTKIEATGTFATLVWYELINCFQGTPPNENMLLLPDTLELNKRYLLLLYEFEPGYYRLVSRSSFFLAGTQEYKDFLIAWDKR